MKKADIGVALYLLAAVIFLIVPINSTLLDVMPVSYTHLDVYKRQDYHTAWIPVELPCNHDIRYAS